MPLRFVPDLSAASHDFFVLRRPRLLLRRLTPAGVGAGVGAGAGAGAGGGVVAAAAAGGGGGGGGHPDLTGGTLGWMGGGRRRTRSRVRGLGTIDLNRSCWGSLDLLCHLNLPRKAYIMGVFSTPICQDVVRNLGISRPKFDK